MRCADGDVAAYLEAARANQHAALEIDDVPTRANAWGYLTDALGFAARLPESIRVAEEGLERFPRHLPVETWSIGVSPHSWYSIWRGFGLVWSGHLREGIEELGRCRRLAEEDGTLEMVGYAVSFSVEAPLVTAFPDGRATRPTRAYRAEAVSATRGLPPDARLEVRQLEAVHERAAQPLERVLRPLVVQRNEPRNALASLRDDHLAPPPRHLFDDPEAWVSSSETLTASACGRVSKSYGHWSILISLDRPDRAGRARSR
jgi:hypothetical protein